MKAIKCKLYNETQWGSTPLVGVFQSIAAAKREAKYLELNRFFIVRCK